MSHPRTLALALAPLLLAGPLFTPAAAQERLIQDMPSPRAEIIQTVGVTRVHVDYSRPGVKGRDVIGNPQIVAFDSPQAWRAGADENTVFSVDRDVRIEGQPLAAGSYGVHMFPKRDAPWTVAFSTNSAAWGSYSYDPAEDALRVDVEAREGSFQEWLEYEFQELDKNGATLVLRWADIEVPLRIEVDTDEHVVEYIRDDYLRGYGFWVPQQLAQAATYCVRNDVNLEEAEGWAQQAATSAPSFAHYTLLATLQDKLGKAEAAEASREQGEQFATEQERNTLGYQLLQGGEVAKAVQVFERNLAAFPMSWNAHDSLAEACIAAGDKGRARELYAKALELAPDEASRTRIQGTLAKLGG